MNIKLTIQSSSRYKSLIGVSVKVIKVILIVLFVIFVLIVLLFCILLTINPNLQYKHIALPTVTPNNIVTTIPTDTFPPSITLTPTDIYPKTSLKTVTYNDLGITFNYISTSFGENIIVARQGNKIYIGTKSDVISSENGNYATPDIEYFEKPSNETLTQAIQTQILKGYSSTNCSVSVTSLSAPSISQKPYDFEVISFVNHDPNNYDPVNYNSSICPLPYTELDDLEIFMMNPNYPQKFLFLNLGLENQFPASLDGYTDWISTIKIF